MGMRYWLLTYSLSFERRNGITGKTKQDSNIYRLYRVIQAAAMREGE